MSALRSGPLIEADCPPAEVEMYLGQLREHLDVLREHADEAREHQRLFEAATLNEMEATEAAAWRLWTSRTELWSALARWEAFLQVGVYAAPPFRLLNSGQVGGGCLHFTGLFTGARTSHQRVVGTGFD